MPRSCKILITTTHKHYAPGLCSVSPLMHLMTKEDGREVTPCFCSGEEDVLRPSKSVRSGVQVQPEWSQSHVLKSFSPLQHAQWGGGRTFLSDGTGTFGNSQKPWDRIWFHDLTRPKDEGMLAFPWTAAHSA